MKALKTLRKGDLVDIVAPGWSCDPAALEKGVRFLESWGLKVRVPEPLFSPDRFYSAPKSLRLKHLKSALSAKDSRAVWCVRGGSGSQLLLPELIKAAPKQSKLFVGFSDMTALHAAFGRVWNWSSVHGAMVEKLGSQELAADIVEQTRAVAFGEIRALTYPRLLPMNSKAQTAKNCQGPVVGGNLTTLQHLVGTKYWPRTKGRLLFFEDVGERGYRIDRIWTQLIQMGVFESCRGVLLGTFLGGEEPQGQPSRVLESLERLAEDVKVPVWRGLECGHGQLQRPLVLGGAGSVKDSVLTVSWKIDGGKP